MVDWKWSVFCRLRRFSGAVLLLLVLRLGAFSIVHVVVVHTSCEISVGGCEPTSVEEVALLLLVLRLLVVLVLLLLVSKLRLNDEEELVAHLQEDWDCALLKVQV